MTVIDPSILENVKVKRQEIVERVVNELDERILSRSDGLEEMTDRLTREAAVAMLHLATKVRDVEPDGNGNLEYDIIRIEVWDAFHVVPGWHNVNDMKQPVKDYILMQVAVRFAEKAAIPFVNRLREYDRNN